MGMLQRATENNEINLPWRMYSIAIKNKHNQVFLLTIISMYGEGRSIDKGFSIITVVRSEKITTLLNNHTFISVISQNYNFSKFRFSLLLVFQLTPLSANRLYAYRL